ncbi:hypothetical protein [Paraburkholderia megapolitana]|uniref:hypothetical protein n=1 Tax=Paraburkholderia megapolitana TaxID=420953 RepID=UPI0038BCAF46
MEPVKVKRQALDGSKSMHTQLNDEMATKRARPAVWIWLAVTAAPALMLLWLLLCQLLVLLARHASGWQGFATAVIVAVPGLLVVARMPGVPGALIESIPARSGVARRDRKHDDEPRGDRP